MDLKNRSEGVRKPSLKESLGILLIIVIIISSGMIVFKAKIQTMMFISWLVIIPAGMSFGYKFADIENMAYDMMRKVMQPTMILLAVGAMVGAWIMSGTVPTLIYGGLAIITPKYFLLTTLLLCSIVSLFTGTSWGTIGTAGLAMMGVGRSMGIPDGITAGAIICGAYFGDKMSPISDSTNLAPAIAGGKLMNHVKHMMWTTVPSYIITAILFTLLGFEYGEMKIDYSQIDFVATTLSSTFKLGIIPLIPCIIVFYLLFRNKPAVPSTLIGALAGVLVAIFYQGATLQDSLTCLYSGFKSASGIEFIDKLLSRGGVASMYDTVGLFLFALGLGGMLNGTGILNSLLDSVASKIKSTRGLVITTMLVSYASGMIGATMSFASVLTGTLMQPLYRKRRLRPENLSRIIEDCGTLGAEIIPWSTGALYPAGVLGVSPYLFIPYCFLSFINPIFTLIYGITGFTMTELDEGEVYGETDEYKISFKRQSKKSLTKSE